MLIPDLDNEYWDIKVVSQLWIDWLIVGPEVMAEGVRASTHWERWRERIPDCGSCNAETICLSELVVCLFACLHFAQSHTDRGQPYWPRSVYWTCPAVSAQNQKWTRNNWLIFSKHMVWLIVQGGSFEGRREFVIQTQHQIHIPVMWQCG